MLFTTHSFACLYNIYCKFFALFVVLKTSCFISNSCRYMKSVFPEADETIILEVLQNNENNIQKTSETLKGMGFEKKDTVKVAQQKMEAKMEQKREEEKIETERVVLPQIKLRTVEEKKKSKSR